MAVLECKQGMRISSRFFFSFFADILAKLLKILRVGNAAVAHRAEASMMTVCAFTQMEWPDLLGWPAQNARAAQRDWLLH
jgi:hypothetical protein